MFYRFNSLGEALKVAYPEYDWDMAKFLLRGKKSTQRWLYVKLKNLLPNAVIKEEYHHPELLWEGNIQRKKKDDYVEKLRLPITIILVSEYTLNLNRVFLCIYLFIYILILIREYKQIYSI